MKVPVSSGIKRYNHINHCQTERLKFCSLFHSCSNFKSKMSENWAVPLCLPNNCKWDEQTGEYSKEEDQDRTSLYVINAALDRLRAIEGRQWRITFKLANKFSSMKEGQSRNEFDKGKLGIAK